MSTHESGCGNDRSEAHTIKRYDDELTHLHRRVLDMGRFVLSQVRDALAAFHARDVKSAGVVMAHDGDVDRMETAADDEIVRLLARRSPLGSDLRVVMAASKSVSELERIGDEAARIASLVTQLFGKETSDPNHRLLRDVNRMAAIAMNSLESALEVYDVWDDDKARAVVARYRDMDDEFQSDLRRLITYIMEDPRAMTLAINVVLTLKALERIGHHSQNLAEYVIFRESGDDIRARMP